MNFLGPGNQKEVAAGNPEVQPQALDGQFKCLCLCDLIVSFALRAGGLLILVVLIPMIRV